MDGLTTANRRIFLALLAIALTVAALTMLYSAPKAWKQSQAPNQGRLWLVAIPAGAAIGFLSSFLGIGSGVFLGPLILFLG
ncbi:MAG: TSUP family transporter [Anaerolineales bacterium]|nr:TSUP family transporter [Anaerolineales bacterium]